MIIIINVPAVVTYIIMLFIIILRSLSSDILDLLCYIIKHWEVCLYEEKKILVLGKYVSSWVKKPSYS